MLTVNDFQNLLNIISSDALSLRGSQALVIAQLQSKLAQAIKEAQATKPRRQRKPKETAVGDSAGPAE